MGDKIEASVRYYQMLADKHEASGRGPHQAKVYRALTALVAQCSSLQEIQDRMKAGGFYESPGQALVLDKLLAHRDAAAKLGHERMAAIYQRRIDAVSADPSAAWATGWERDVAKEGDRIAQVADALSDAMSAYFELRCASCVSQDAPIEKIRTAVRRIQANGETFEAVAGHPYYRKHVAFVDEVYARALQTIREVVAHTPDVRAAVADLEARARAMIAGGDAASLEQKRRAYQARQRRSINLCVAPDDAPGEYTYEPFFEGEL